MSEAVIILGLSLALVIGGIAFLVASVVALWKHQWRKAGARFGLAVICLALVAMILPEVAHGSAHPTRDRCTSNLRQIGLGCKMYAMDHNEELPASFGMLTGYADDPKLFVCPASGHDPGSIQEVDEWTDYAYVVGLREADSPRCVLAFCPLVNHDGKKANVLFRDCSVVTYTPKHFAALTNNPALFFGTTNMVALAEIQRRARVLKGSKQIEGRR
jgi:hypothetical protein